MTRKTQTVYVETDRLFSERGRVLFGFERFLEGLAGGQTPCVWVTSWTRAQLDEPRRRLGQSDPFIGENGCGVYLPEDYFHLKGSQTIRLGRYTCIPIAKPQPAAAEALEELASDTGISAVPLRSLSHRELSLNTGLPARDAELIRLRDFDELFFFAGASESDVGRFMAEAGKRGFLVQRAGGFWSLSVGGSLAKCVRELGGLYDRAIRSRALRIGVRALIHEAKEGGAQDSWPAKAFDRNFVIEDREERGDRGEERPEASEGTQADAAAVEAGGLEGLAEPTQASRNSFSLHARNVWEELLSAIEGGAGARGISN